MKNEDMPLAYPFFTLSLVPESYLSVIRHDGSFPLGDPDGFSPELRPAKVLLPERFPLAGLLLRRRFHVRSNLSHCHHPRISYYINYYTNANSFVNPFWKTFYLEKDLANPLDMTNRRPLR